MDFTIQTVSRLATTTPMAIGIRPLILAIKNLIMPSVKIVAPANVARKIVEFSKIFSSLFKGDSLQAGFNITNIVLKVNIILASSASSCNAQYQPHPWFYTKTRYQISLQEICARSRPRSSASWWKLWPLGLREGFLNKIRAVAVTYWMWFWILACPSTLFRINNFDILFFIFDILILGPVLRIRIK